MSIAEFVSHLRNLDIRLSAENDRLRVNAPKGVLNEGLRAQIADRKQELLEYPTRLSTTNGFCPSTDITARIRQPANLCLSPKSGCGS